MGAYNDAVLADLDMITDGSCLNDGVSTNVDVISYLHRIVIEVSAVRLVRWPAGKSVSASYPDPVQEVSPVPMGPSHRYGRCLQLLGISNTWQATRSK